MDKLAALTAFAKVVEMGGFAAAAREMGLSRSQVNRSVIGLEDALNAQLLNRTTRRVAATPTGRAFYERCRAILNDLAEAEHAVRAEQDTPRGEIKINAPMSFGTLHLAPALVDFMQRYPDIRVQLVLSDGFVDPIADGYDMTVRIAEPAEMPSLIDHEVVEAKRAICAAPGFLKDHGTPTVAGELSRLPCLHYGNLPSGGAWRLKGPEGWKDVRVNGVLCSNNAEVLCDAAIGGMGIALLPTFIAGRELQAGRLVSILPDYQAPPLKLILLYPPNRHLSARIRALVEFLYERFGDRPYWDLIG